MAAKVSATNNVDAIVARTRERATRLVRGTAQKVKGRAVDLVPVDTGRLQHSIEVHDADQGALIQSEVTAGGGEVDYELHVEYGTRHSAGSIDARSAPSTVIRPALGS